MKFLTIITTPWNVGNAHVFSAWKRKMADYSLSRVDERLASPSSRWYFSKDDIRNSPSRAHGVDPAKELNYRQHAANLIQDMGNRLGL